VHRILSDAVYTGTAYNNRYALVPPRRPRSRGPRAYENTCRRPRPREEWLGVPVPAIIDEAIHLQAQEQLRRNSALSFRYTTRNDYLLRCLLTCRTCGLAMFSVTHPATERQPEHRSCQCHGKDCVVRGRDRGCPPRAAKAEELEAAVWHHIKQPLNNPEPTEVGKRPCAARGWGRHLGATGRALGAPCFALVPALVVGRKVSA
jgi:site-specific DNA recombinase